MRKKRDIIGQDEHTSCPQETDLQKAERYVQECQKEVIEAQIKLEKAQSFRDGFVTSNYQTDLNVQENIQMFLQKQAEIRATRYTSKCKTSALDASFLSKRFKQ